MVKPLYMKKESYFITEILNLYVLPITINGCVIGEQFPFIEQSIQIKSNLNTRFVNGIAKFC